MKRKYSIYYKIDCKYRRISPSAYHKDIAVRVFKNALLDGLLYEACLRPIKEGEAVYEFVSGAYGARYTTPNAALAAWKAGADFKICGGPYCSSRDDIHVLIRLENGEVVVAHGTLKEKESTG